jgi:hypothetical protein
MPDHPIDRCKADCGLIAYSLVSKYADHLPLYRQDSIFEREGVKIPRSILDNWAMLTADALRPLGEALKAAVLDTDVLFTDDSVITLLETGRGKTRQARLRVYIRGGTGPPSTAFDLTIDRRKQRPMDYLGDYCGYIHADAYSGYDALFARDGVVEVGCYPASGIMPRLPDEALETGGSLDWGRGGVGIITGRPGRPTGYRLPGSDREARPSQLRVRGPALSDPCRRAGRPGWSLWTRGPATARSWLGLRVRAGPGQGDPA